MLYLISYRFLLWWNMTWTFFWRLTQAHMIMFKEDTLSFPCSRFKLDDKGGWDKHAAILQPCSLVLCLCGTNEENRPSDGSNWKEPGY